MKNFESRILGFCCDWAACSGIKRAGINETQYPPNFCLLPVTCSSLIAPETILEALGRGFDGVFITACPYYSKAFPHHTGNHSASYNVARFKAILSCPGIEPERIRFGMALSSRSAKVCSGN